MRRAQTKFRLAKNLRDRLTPTSEEVREQYGYGSARLVRDLVAGTAAVAALFAATPARAAGTYDAVVVGGHLFITDNANVNDAFEVTVGNLGNVRVNNLDPDSGSFPANQITRIIIDSAGGADVIDLDQVTKVGFPALSNGMVFVDTGNGPDSVIGSEYGDQVLTGVNNDTVEGGDGPDAIDTGDGTDSVDGGNGDDYIDGGAEQDILNGEVGDDQIYGGGGIDAIDGGPGADYLEGGGGADNLNGNDGADTINSTAGKDDIFGGIGDDLIIIANDNDGTDSDGEAGNDSIRIFGTQNDDVAVLTDGQVNMNGHNHNYNSIENVTVDTLGGQDEITVNGSDTTVLGGAGSDTFTVNATGPSSLTLNGQGAADTYTVAMQGLGGPVIIDDTDGGNCPANTLIVNAGGVAITPATPTPCAGVITQGGQTLTYGPNMGVTVINAPVPTLAGVAKFLLAGLLIVSGWFGLKRRTGGNVQGA